MSKIGKKPIVIPQGVEVKLENGVFEAKGSRGTLKVAVSDGVKVEIGEGVVNIKREDVKSNTSAIWGLMRALINNVIIGVSSGYEKKLELQGVGFRMSIQGKKIVMALGFSHPVEKEIPDGLTAKIEENNVLSISGIDKQVVGQFAADIRSLKEVEPYKGKGFRYVGEKVRKKAGKKAGAK